MPSTSSHFDVESRQTPGAKAWDLGIKWRSGRIGRTGRTMHNRVGSITRKNGGAAKAIKGLDYDARQGAHVRRADELEIEGGRDRRKMSKILEAAERANTRKNAKVALDGEIELPAEFTPAARRAVAERLGEWFEKRDCPAHWAIHTHNERKQFQPHLHWTAAARPVRLADGEWIGTTPGSRGHAGPAAVISGPDAMRQFRRDIADIINEVAAEQKILLAAAWSGGRLAETGIVRPAKKRVPMGVYKAAEAGRINRVDQRPWSLAADGPARSNAAIDQGHFDTARASREAFVLRSNDERRRRRETAERERQEFMAKHGLIAIESASERERRAKVAGRTEGRGEALRELSLRERNFLSDKLRIHGVEDPAIIEAADVDQAVRTIAFKLSRTYIETERADQLLRQLEQAHQQLVRMEKAAVHFEREADRLEAERLSPAELGQLLGSLERTGRRYRLEPGTYVGADVGRQILADLMQREAQIDLERRGRRPSGRGR